MKYRIPAFCLFVLSPLFVFSQGSFSYDIELRHVNFQNGTTMRLDDNSANYANINEYELVGGGVYTTAPVAYVAGNSFTVAASFQTNCLEADLHIRGKHIRPDGTVLTFPAQGINSGSNGELQYTSAQPLDNTSPFYFPGSTVEFHDPFEILWQFSLNDSPNDTDWIDIHTSSNPVYVAKAGSVFTSPDPSYIPQLPYHTYFRTSCEAAADLTTDDEIIQAVWAVFQTTNSFVRVDDDEPLAYYGDWTNADFWADDMMLSANGQCSAFSMAFLNCLKVHGINQSYDYLWVNPVMPQSNLSFGFLVNDYMNIATDPFDHWTNNTAPSVPSGFNIAKVVIPNQTDPYNFTSSNFEDNVLYSDIADVIGVPGQNEDNPKSVFVNHQIISLQVGGNTKLYDVPYGETYDSLDEMKDNIYGYILEVITQIDETSLGMDLNGNGFETNATYTVWLIDTNPNAFDLEPDPNNSF